MDSKYYAIQIVKQLVKEGYIAYFAGGWVRDYVMNYPSADIDIATNAPPEKILNLFSKTILVGLAFGVIIVIIEGHQFEVSTFRRDLGYEDGRKPVQIELSTPEEDALRRDFTINGLFFDPLEGMIIDYVGGLADIKKGVIRAIGNPEERFVEDRLRMIRAIRFAARFGFAIDGDTQLGILMNADTLFPAVAKERIWQEFKKMVAYPHFDSALIELHRLKLLPVIFPILEKLHLNELKHRVSQFIHFPSNCPTILYLMALFPEATLEEKVAICHDLKTSGKDIQLVEFTYFLKQLINYELLRLKKTDLSEWALIYVHPFYQIGLQVIAAAEEESIRKELLETHSNRYSFLSKSIERLIAKKPLVNAALLQEHGIQPGKTMGLLIKEAEKIAINQNLQESDTIISLLKKSPLWPEK